MRPRLAPRKPLGACRLRRSGEVWEAVADGGVLVARAPARDAILTLIRRQGGCVRTGKAPAARKALAMGTPFQLRVWAELLRIPRGKAVTYGEVARRLGCRSPRAVGQAAGANPLMGLIPCHRLVAAAGPGGFAWGAAAKRRLTRREAGDA